MFDLARAMIAAVVAIIILYVGSQMLFTAVGIQ